MFKRLDLKIVLFFVVLTVIMTIGVIAFWEEVLRPPFYAWVEARYPGVHYAEFRWNIQQRVEHFFISVTVDALVVTLLLRLVHRTERVDDGRAHARRRVGDAAEADDGVVVGCLI